MHTLTKLAHQLFLICQKDLPYAKNVATVLEQWYVSQGIVGGYCFMHCKMGHSDVSSETPTTEAKHKAKKHQTRSNEQW